jgi:hypothetical protein
MSSEFHTLVGNAINGQAKLIVDQLQRLLRERFFIQSERVQEMERIRESLIVPKQKKKGNNKMYHQNVLEWGKSGMRIGQIAEHSCNRIHKLVFVSLEK